MAQLANISLKNAAAVEQVYSATPGSSPDSVNWYNGAGSWAARYKAYLSHKLQASNATSGINRVTLGHVTPAVDPVTGQLLYSLQYKLEAFLPVQCTQAERDEQYARFVDLLADPVASAALKSYDMPY
jgi:hypothetical protein